MHILHVRLHHDLATGSNDYIRDDMTVSFSMESILKNMIVTGNDVRVVDSIIGAIKYFSDTNTEYVLLNAIFSSSISTSVRQYCFCCRLGTFKDKSACKIIFQICCKSISRIGTKRS
mgnify:CR=1 FL=1